MSGPLTGHSNRRILTMGVCAVATVVASLVTAAPPASADHAVSSTRIEGGNEYETAAEVARFTHPDGSAVALLASGTDFPDALAGAALARTSAAPILLTAPDTVPAATDQVLAELGVQRVVLLGGPSAISQAVEDELRAAHDTVERIEGATRFETAVDVAHAVEDSPDASIGSIDGMRAAIIVNGTAFPDAISAGALAAGAANPFPILLTERDRLHPSTDTALDDLGIQRVMIVGGTGVVTSEVETRLGDKGIEVTRLGGENRSDTATLVAEHAVAVAGFDLSTVHLARGDFFTDALAAGPMAGLDKSPILLNPTPTVLGEDNTSWLREQCPDIGAVRALGGPLAVSRNVLLSTVDWAVSCHEAQDSQTFVVSPQEPVSASPGERLEASVFSRYDDAELIGPVNVAFFPCETTQVVGADPQTFRDVNGDGYADRRGRSDNGVAAIIDLNGESVAPTGQLEDVRPARDGSGLTVGTVAEGPDCLVPTVYDDTNDNGHLDVDADGLPLERFGVTQFSWS